jgi:hypothetical protein
LVICSKPLRIVTLGLLSIGVKGDHAEVTVLEGGGYMECRECVVAGRGFCAMKGIGVFRFCYELELSRIGGSG